jgi:hypothetical protein
LTTIAALVLFTGCGGGSGNPGHSAPRARGLVGLGLAREVSAKEGAFRTVIPLGFEYNPSQGQYDIEGSGAVGGSQVAVVREPVQPEVLQVPVKSLLHIKGINFYARRTAYFARRVPSIHRISRPSALIVGGAPALAMEYESREKRVVGKNGGAPAEVSTVRTVFVRHGEFVYIIRAAWQPGQRAPALAALEQVLSRWQWQ